MSRKFLSLPRKVNHERSGEMLTYTLDELRRYVCDLARHRLMDLYADMAEFSDDFLRGQDITSEEFAELKSDWDAAIDELLKKL